MDRGSSNRMGDPIPNQTPVRSGPLSNSRLESSSQEIVVIAALAESNRVIGRQGTMPWHLPEDLHRFRSLTWGYPIIMGRKTWEFGLGKRTLPHRLNIVVSRSLGMTLSDERLSIHSPDPTQRVMVRSLADAFMVAHRYGSQGNPTPEHISEQIPEYISEHISEHKVKRVFVIGGASLYAQTLDQADRLELTLIHGTFEGDAYFPDCEPLLAHFECVGSDYQAHCSPPCTYRSYVRR